MSYISLSHHHLHQTKHQILTSRISPSGRNSARPVSLTLEIWALKTRESFISLLVSKCLTRSIDSLIELIGLVGWWVGGLFR